MSKTLTCLALGSRGDVQPYVALSAGLRDAGYRVRVVTFESFRTLVEGQGLLFHAVPGDAQAILQAGANADMLGTRNPLKLMRGIMRSYGAIITDYIEVFSDDVLSDSDAILNQLPGGLFGVDLAEKLNVPHISLSVIPLTPTHAWPNPLLSERSLGPLNKASYAASAQLVWAFFRPHVRRFRERIGLTTPPPRWLRAKGKLTINGFSPLVVPPPKDWDSTVHTTGYWQLSDPPWQPDADLLAFLEAGSKPVFIGFGSMIAPDRAALTRTVIEAVERSGQRAILSGGWGDLGAQDLPPTMRRIEYVPYRWLFSHMAAVIHHGGSGTTGLALSSGVPSMVVAFGTEQLYWGGRIAALGAGLPPLFVKRLDADTLAERIRALVSDDGMRERAAALGARLRAEDGIGAAVGVIRMTII